MGTFFYEILPTGWPYSAMILALTLFSGLVFMAVLVFIDPVLYTWMMDSLRPSSRRSDRHRHQHQRSPVTSESATLEPSLAPMKIGMDPRNKHSYSFPSFYLLYGTNNILCCWVLHGQLFRFLVVIRQRNRFRVWPNNFWESSVDEPYFLNQFTHRFPSLFFWKRSLIA